MIGISKHEDPIKSVIGAIYRNGSNSNGSKSYTVNSEWYMQ